ARHFPSFPTRRSSDLYLPPEGVPDMGTSLNSPSWNATSRTAPCGPNGPSVFPLARMVNPPALPARNTAGSRISTLWIVPGSISRSEEHTSELQPPDHL